MPVVGALEDAWEKGKKKKGLKAYKQQIRPLSDILENRRIGFLAQRKRES